MQSSTASKNAWKQTVAAAARAKCAAPLADQDLRITITIFYNQLPDFDTENISKPICDALNQIVYEDDHQLADRTVRRRDINSSFRIRGIDPELAVAIVEGDDFVYIVVDRVGSEAEQL